MSEFFKTLNEMTDPKVLLVNKNGNPFMVLDTAGLEVLCDSVFSDDKDLIFSNGDKLLWAEISAIDFERVRLGRFHLPIIRFKNIDAVLNRLSDEKSAMLKNSREYEYNGYRLPLTEAVTLMIQGVATYESLKGLNPIKKVAAMKQVLCRFTDIPIEIVEDRMMAANSISEEAINEKDALILLMHTQRIKSAR